MMIAGEAYCCLYCRDLCLLISDKGKDNGIGTTAYQEKDREDRNKVIVANSTNTKTTDVRNPNTANVGGKSKEYGEK